MMSLKTNSETQRKVISKASSNIMVCLPHSRKKVSKNYFPFNMKHLTSSTREQTSLRETEPVQEKLLRLHYQFFRNSSTKAFAMMRNRAPSFLSFFQPGKLIFYLDNSVFRSKPKFRVCQIQTKNYSELFAFMEEVVFTSKLTSSEKVQTSLLEHLGV